MTLNEIKKIFKDQEHLFYEDLDEPHFFEDSKYFSIFLKEIGVQVDDEPDQKIEMTRSQLVDAFNNTIGRNVLNGVAMAEHYKDKLLEELGFK